jgi:hypothetical protein
MPEKMKKTLFASAVEVKQFFNPKHLIQTGRKPVAPLFHSITILNLTGYSGLVPQKQQQHVFVTQSYPKSGFSLMR